MLELVKKWQGEGEKLPPPLATSTILLTWVGALLAISTIASLTNLLAVGLIFAPLGASCMLVFGFPDGIFAQPRNVVCGHFVSSLIGLLAFNFLGEHWWSVAFAVSTAIATMMLLRIVHPPAASNPVLIYLSHPSWKFLFFPTLTGTLLLVVVALLYHNATREARYPKYW